MAFYPQFPIYAYPMPFPNQEFYAMYPPGGMDASGPLYFDPTMSQGQSPNSGGPGHHHHHNNNNHYKGKHGYNNRKESQDSGISEFSLSSNQSRKISQSSLSSDNDTIVEETTDKEEPPYEKPDDDLCEKIVTQVEFYFSDANITKDKFLLKHVKRNKEGFVSLKLISSFKRVKHLTKDWRQVAEAIERKSNRLEVNDLKTKVRRLEALPEYDETTPSRTVVALNLPMDRPTIEGVAEIFAVCGEIVLVRILRPGNPIPADIKPFTNKHPEMTAKVCALIEFEKTEFALKAVRELNEDEEGKMRVMELTAPPAKSNKKDDKKKQERKQSGNGPAQAPQRRFSHAGIGMNSHPQPDMSGTSVGPRRRISLLHNMKFAPICEEMQPKEFSLNPNAPSFQMQRKMSRPTHFVQVDSTGQVMGVAQAPWISRRMSAIHNGHEMATSGLTIPANVIRMPRGPERGKGFQRWCRNRMSDNNNHGSHHNASSHSSSSSSTTPAQKRISRAVPIVPPPIEESAPAAKPASTPAAEPAADGAAAAAPAASPSPAAASGSSEEERQQEMAQAIAEADAEIAAAAAAGRRDSCSDSGHEDSCSDTDVDINVIINNNASGSSAAKEAERSR